MQQVEIKHTSKDFNEPLIWLSDSSIAIFPDHIVQYSKWKGKPTTNVTLPTLDDLDQADKSVSFSKGDVAFKIEEKRVNILKIKNDKPVLEFVVGKQADLVIVQQILRRKLCEIGFEQKFVVLKQLGKGATARVYLVQRKADKKLFAAKVISLKTAQNKEYQSFINQTKILKCMKNRYIVAIESLYISKKELISVLEYLEGGTLLQQLRNNVLKTDEQRLKAIKDLTEGLEHMRQKRIVHRDLKLQNIMVRINADKSKDYVITDFGLACWIGEQELIFQRCGTPGYIAPQILRSNKSKVIVSHECDVFSLGVLYHFIMLLRAVFPYNGNAKQLLTINKRATFSLDSKYHMQLMESERRLLAKTLELDVSKRASSRQLLDVYIKEYEREVKVGQKRKDERKKEKEKGKEKEKIESQETTNRHYKIQMGNSIEVIEKRAPSLDRSQFSSRLKTQPNEKALNVEKREGSVSKFLGKVWNRISSSKSQVLKKKQDPSVRKMEIKKFLP